MAEYSRPPGLRLEPPVDAHGNRIIEPKIDKPMAAAFPVGSEATLKWDELMPGLPYAAFNVGGPPIKVKIGTRLQIYAFRSDRDRMCNVLDGPAAGLSLEVDMAHLTRA